MKSTLLIWHDELITLYEWDDSVNPVKAQMTLIWSRPDYKFNWPAMENNGGVAKWPSDVPWTDHPWVGIPNYWQKVITYNTQIITIPVPDLEKA
jgi:hypothetical protein